MDAEGKLGVWLASLLAIVLCTLIITIAVGSYNNNKLFATNGYEKQMLIGYSSPIWVKAD